MLEVLPASCDINSMLKRWFSILLAAAVIISLVSAITKIVPVGPDYFYTFRPVAERWLGGQTHLYDEYSQGFFNPPWALGFVMPLLALSIESGQALLMGLSIVCLLTTIHIFRNRRSVGLIIILLALINLQTFDLLIEGPFDALVLLGVALGYLGVKREKPLLLSAAFWLMAIKPPNVLLVAILFLLSIRGWSVSRGLVLSSLLIVSFLFSALVAGLDWPIRYIVNLQSHPPYSFPLTTIWRGASQIGIHPEPLYLLGLIAVLLLANLVRRVGLNRQTLSITLATNLVFTPYALDHHYVLLVPVFLFVGYQNWRFAILAYCTTWLPLLRLGYGWTVTWVDTLYPVFLLIASWWVSSTRKIDLDRQVVGN